MGRIHSILSPVSRFKAYLRRLWALEHTPTVLAILLCLAVYIVLTTQLVEYIVGGV